jgi:uncharacterized protein
MSDRSLPPPLRDLLQRLEAGLRDLYGERYRGLLLFGSHARGDAREGSDIDLLLLLDGSVDPVREILRMEPVTWPLSLAEDVVLSVVPVSKEDFDCGEGRFLRTVRQEAVRAA